MMRTGDLYDRPGTFPGSTGAMAPLQPTEAWPRVSALCLSWRWHGIAAAGAAPKWQDRLPRVSTEINCSAIRKTELRRLVKRYIQNPGFSRGATRNFKSFKPLEKISVRLAAPRLCPFLLPSPPPRSSGRTCQTGILSLKGPHAKKRAPRGTCPASGGLFVTTVLR